MALINCPECGKEISDKANACPNCGYKTKKEIQVNKKHIIVLMASIIAVVGIIFEIKIWGNSMPTELSLTLGMTQEEVHNRIGTDFKLEQDKYEHDIEVYDLRWCGYDGKLSITYSLNDKTISDIKWEVDTSEMTDQDIENAMVKIRDKISDIYGEPEESNVSRLEYKWRTTHIEKHNVLFDVGYKLIREDVLWLHYGEVY